MDDTNRASQLVDALQRAEKLEALAGDVFRDVRAQGASPASGHRELVSFGEGTECDGEKIKHDCSQDAQSCMSEPGVAFQCTSSGYIYNCSFFSCSQIGTTSDDFQCKATYDFICYNDHDCEDFTCDSGHVFFCGADHDCTENHGCMSTTNIPCTGDYEIGTDTTSGDFQCGYKDPNDFDCHDGFGCLVPDDFQCGGFTTATPDFNCGNGETSDVFSCNTGTSGSFHCMMFFTCDAPSPGQFNCYHDFSCDHLEYFSCPHEFNCGE